MSIYRACVFPYCNVDDRREAETLSYHKIPNPETPTETRQRWIDLIRDARGDQNWKPGKYSSVCSRHFPLESFIEGPRRRLNPGAVPIHNLDDLVFPAVNNNPHDTEDDVLTDTASEHEDEPMLLECNSQVLDTKTLNCPCCFNSLSLNTLLDGKIEIKASDVHCSTPVKRPRMGYKCRKRIFDEVLEQEVSSNNATDTALPTTLPTTSSSIVVTPRSRQRVRNEHNYYASPGKAADELKSVKSELAELKLKYRSLQKKLERRDKKTATVEDKLVEQNVLSLQQISNLQDDYPHLLRTLIENEKVALDVKGKTGMAYQDEMKKFAATLHFYSPKAYNFIREYLTLPHPHTISSWMKSSDCGPGFNVDVISRLSEARKVDSTVMTDITLMIDEMAIRVELVWSPSCNRYVGHIDYGMKDIDASDSPLASNVLVCMIAGISGGWKVPIGYIFTDKTDSQVQKTFVDKAFYHLESAGFAVHSITSDGNTANVSLFELYGVVENKLDRLQPLEYSDIKTHFPNPANESKLVHAMYDTCHMLKLWRNLLAQCGKISLSDNRVVDWKYIVRLHDLQEKEKIRAANKLGRNHIEFQNHKMNVKLAAQSLSKSNADAIVFCRDKLRLSEFQGSEGTTYFMFLLDKVFDILNSRSPAQKCHKSPLKRSNFQYQSAILMEFCNVVLQMTYTEVRNYKATKNKPDRSTQIVKFLVQSARKRAAIGMVVTIKSTLAVSAHLLYREVNPIKFVMTYRFSQDLLELFFNKIRGRLGRNNNPNVLEFIAAIKAVWHQNLLKSTNTGNCVQQMSDGNIPGGLLPLKRCKVQKLVRLELSDIGDLESIDLDSFHDPKYSPFYKNSLAYIAGNVIRVVGTKIQCEICAEALLDNELDPLDAQLRHLITVKDRGGLFTPCQSVYKIVELTDSIYRQLQKESIGTLSIIDLDRKIFKQVVIKCLETPVFPHICTHYIDFEPLSSKSHLYKLIRDIVLYFLKIRLFDYGRRFQKSKEISTRQTRSRLTIFKGQ